MPLTEDQEADAFDAHIWGERATAEVTLTTWDPCVLLRARGSEQEDIHDRGR